VHLVGLSIEYTRKKNKFVCYYRDSLDNESAILKTVSMFHLTEAFIRNVNFWLPFEISTSSKTDLLNYMNNLSIFGMYVVHAKCV
jgi:hypothetical protein